MDEKQISILCDCYTEMLLCSKYEDEDEIYLSIYTQGQYNKKPSIWNRITYCFYHLRTGKIYEDQLVLKKEKAKELGKWLVENSL